MSNQPPEIVPAIKISQLLDAYPQLEEQLIKLSPAFKKLQNPMLRKTVAKLATLAQAAKIGKVPIQEMVNILRAAVGQEPIDVTVTEEITSEHAPPWFKTLKISGSLDGRPLLDAGEFPLNRVLEDLKKLADGEGYELTAPFLPAPLIEKVMKKGYACWAREDKANGCYLVYFTKQV